jgi:hypothetical protein
MTEYRYTKYKEYGMVYRYGYCSTALCCAVCVLPPHIYLVYRILSRYSIVYGIGILYTTAVLTESILCTTCMYSILYHIRYTVCVMYSNTRCAVCIILLYRIVTKKITIIVIAIRCHYFYFITASLI